MLSFLSCVQSLVSGVRNVQKLQKLVNYAQFTERDYDNLLKTNQRGHLGLIVSLEGALVNINKMTEEAARRATEKFRRDQDSINHDLEFQNAFDFALDKLIDDNDPKPNKKVPQFLRDSLDDGNAVIVFTELPRRLAAKLMGRTQLSLIFDEYHVSDKNFVCNNGHAESSDEIRQPKDHDFFLTCCSLFNRPKELVAVIDSNGKNLMLAHRNGLNVIGLKGIASSIFRFGINMIVAEGQQSTMDERRYADIVANSLEELSLSAVYRVSALSMHFCMCVMRA